MKIIKPSYLNDKNLISYLLMPFTFFTILINFSKDFLIKNPGCVISNLVVNKELFIGLGGFDEYIHPSNDKDFIIRALYFGYNYDVVEENLVNLRRHTGKRETDISSEFLIGMKKFFNKHYFIASPLVKIKFWFKYWLLYVKSKI